LVRPAAPADHAAIRTITDAAFGGPDESAIIDGVRAENRVLVELVAEQDGEVFGHILFSRMTVTPDRFFAGLGPVCVRPDTQRSGLGQTLCRAGIEALRDLGVEAVVVLGHLDYYPRFGFSHEAAAKLTSPYSALPGFMALALKTGALDHPLKVDYPAAFSPPA
jgi:putative acetyltransferase